MIERSLFVAVLVPTPRIFASGLGKVSYAVRMVEIRR